MRVAKVRVVSVPVCFVRAVRVGFLNGSAYFPGVGYIAELAGRWVAFFLGVAVAVCVVCGVVVAVWSDCLVFVRERYDYGVPFGVFDSCRVNVRDGFRAFIFGHACVFGDAARADDHEWQVARWRVLVFCRRDVGERACSVLWRDRVCSWVPLFLFLPAGVQDAASPVKGGEVYVAYVKDAHVTSVVWEWVNGVVGVLVAGGAGANAWLWLVGGYLVFRRLFFYGVPDYEREQRGAPLVSFDGFEEAIMAHDHHWWVFAHVIVIGADSVEWWYLLKPDYAWTALVFFVAESRAVVSGWVDTGPYYHDVGVVVHDPYDANAGRHVRLVFTGESFVER